VDAWLERTISPGPVRPPSIRTPDGVSVVFSGHRWTCCDGVEALLSTVPERAWACPEGQGWERVKQNARREVWRAVIGGVPYYLKYYFQESWPRRLKHLFRTPACQAEWEGGRFARRAGIPAACPVACTGTVRRGRRRAALLVTEALEPAQPLNEFWLQLHSDPDVRRRRADTLQLMELLAEMIARAHQAGLEHLDMHAANILVQTVGPGRYRTVFVDLQSVRRDRPLSVRAVVRNLAQLNQWFGKHSSVGDRLRFLRAYLRWRNEFEARFEHGRSLKLGYRELVRALARAAQRHARRLWGSRDRRLGRDGRYFTRLRLPGGWRGMAVTACKHPAEESRASRLVFDRAWWQRTLGRPLDFFNAASACKDSHSAEVRRTLLKHPDESLPVILKRPRARNGWRRLVQLLPPSRSRRGWQLGHALLHRDLPTARPLAFLERRWGPFILDSLLITEAIPGAVDLESYLRAQQASLPGPDWLRVKRQLCLMLARLLRGLQQRGFRHRDCKASNVLVMPYPQPKLIWIDMDGLRHGGRESTTTDLRPLVRMEVSLRDLPGLTRADRVRFLKAYFAGYGATRDRWRTLWPKLAAAADRKARAKHARRLWKLKHYGRE